MTQQAAAFRDHLSGGNPLALTNRPVRPDADASRLSRFDDDRWDLTPGIFEDHSTKTSLNFEVFPIRWRVAVKEYFWLLINDETIRPLPAAQLDKRLSLRTISFASTPLARVLAWAEERGITSLNELSPIRWQHLGRLTHTLGGTHLEFDQDLIRQSGLEIDGDTYLSTLCKGTINGHLWRSKPIAFDDAADLAQHLVTTCFILIAYLSGMRPGEVLSLKRNCVAHDKSTGLWTIIGVRWKDATDHDGAKAVEGEQRGSSLGGPPHSRPGSRRPDPAAPRNSRLPCKHPAKATARPGRPDQPETGHGPDDIAGRNRHRRVH